MEFDESKDTNVTPEHLEHLLEESQKLSREVAHALVSAAKTRDSTDHLLRTWQARHDLPCDAERLDASAFPRPPPGTRREVRPTPRERQHISRSATLQTQHCMRISVDPLCRRSLTWHMR